MASTLAMIQSNVNPMPQAAYSTKQRDASGPENPMCCPLITGQEGLTPVIIGKLTKNAPMNRLITGR
jgi:hypothetical protein